MADDVSHELSRETRLVTGRLSAVESPEPLTVPIYHTSTYRYTSTEQYTNVSLNEVSILTSQ